MQVSATTQPARDSDADTVALGVFEGEDAPAQAPAEAAALLASREARGTLKSLALTHSGGKRWLLVGLGPREGFTPERARVAAAAACERTRELSTASLCWQLPLDGDAAVAGALVEGTILADYRFERHKSAPAQEPHAPPKALERLIIAAE